MEDNSGVKFREAQVALARQWVGDSFVVGEKGPTEVTIKDPEFSKEGISVSNETKVKSETIKLPATEQEAKDIIEQFQHGADNIRGDDDVSDTVTQHMLNDRTSLLDEKWLGSEEEEKNASVISSITCFPD